MASTSSPSVSRKRNLPPLSVYTSKSAAPALPSPALSAPFFCWPDAGGGPAPPRTAVRTAAANTLRTTVHMILTLPGKECEPAARMGRPGTDNHGPYDTLRGPAEVAPAIPGGGDCRAVTRPHVEVRE